jgi:hypothetical protein
MPAVCALTSALIFSAHAHELLQSFACAQLALSIALERIGCSAHQMLPCLRAQLVAYLTRAGRATCGT